MVVSLGWGVLQLCDKSVNFVENETRFDTLHPRLLEDNLRLKINKRREEKEGTRRKTRERKRRERKKGRRGRKKGREERGGEGGEEGGRYTSG